MIPFAIHGLRCPLPDAWDAVGTYGGWRKGQALFAEDRQPRLSLAWERRDIAPDLERSLARSAGGAVARQYVIDGRPELSALGGDGLLARWSVPGGSIHAGIRRFMPHGLTVIARQLAPGAAGPVRALLAGCEAFAEDGPIPWSLYGLRVDLPPWWRLQGVQPVAGMVRAVWFRQPQGGMRADAVLVVRRIALAARLLGDGDVLGWLRRGLRRDERVIAAVEDHGISRLLTSHPADSWWRRLRRIDDRRHFHAWIESADDRLMVQEYKGAGEPLGCLRG